MPYIIAKANQSMYPILLCANYIKYTKQEHCKLHNNFKDHTCNMPQPLCILENTCIFDYALALRLMLYTHICTGEANKNFSPHDITFTIYNSCTCTTQNSHDFSKRITQLYYHFIIL